jgi:hypothetical protein
MGMEYSYDVGYGFVVRPEDTGIIEALSKELGDDDLPILSFGLDWEKFHEAYPLLKFGTSGNDGDDCNLVIMLAGSHRDLDTKYENKVGAFELRERDLADEELMQLVTFASKYGIVGTPSWVAYTSIS